jgi:hypothetical protein
MSRGWKSSLEFLFSTLKVNGCVWPLQKIPSHECPGISLKLGPL